MDDYGIAVERSRDVGVAVDKEARHGAVVDELAVACGLRQYGARRRFLILKQSERRVQVVDVPSVAQVSRECGGIGRRITEVAAMRLLLQYAVDKHLLHPFAPQLA